MILIMFVLVGVVAMVVLSLISVVKCVFIAVLVSSLRLVLLRAGVLVLVVIHALV